MYHVQTEDKGAPARMIMSLVYDRGTILASKRATYEDLETVEYDEKEIAERLSRQHKLMCAAVKAGRIDELVKMTRSTSAGTKAKAAGEPLLNPADAAMLVETLTEMPKVRTSQPAIAVLPNDPFVPRGPIKIGMVEMENEIDPIPAYMFEEEELVLDAMHIIEDEEIEILASEAVAIMSELSGQERSTNQKLSLELLSDTRFKGGDRRTVSIMMCRGTGRKVVADAQIMIKILGSSFRPVIFHAKTDFNGLARVHLQVPQFQAGRAALLIRAITDGEEIELRRVVTPG